MPRIRHWFHVSHDINSDPEVWELTDKFGLTGLRVWLELLSIGDRNEGHLPELSQACVRQLSIKCNSTQTRVRLVLDWTLTRSWVVCDPSPRLRNWLIYNPPRDAKKSAVSSPPIPSPSDSSPNLPKEKIKSIAPNQNFPDEWKWLEVMIRSQNSGFPIERFLDFAWWDAVSYQCGGLSAPFLEKELAGMKRWIMDNPARTPTPRGYRKFVAHWLERAHDKERRFK